MPERTPESAQVDARIVEMRRTKTPFIEIAAELGISKQAVNQRWKKIMKGVEDRDVHEVRREEVDELDALAQQAWRVLKKDHLAHSHGKIVQKVVGRKLVLDADNQPVIRDGEPLWEYVYEDVLDDGPKLQAIDRLLKIQHRRAALLGLDAPQKLEHSGEVNVHTTTPIDEEIAQLQRDLGLNDAVPTEIASSPGE
jgi:AcrR family transcriptional regulator